MTTLFVKSKSGGCYPVEVDHHTTVFEFKQRLALSMKRNAAELNLIDHGSSLNNNDLMSTALVEGIELTGVIHVSIDPELPKESRPMCLDEVCNRLLEITNCYLNKPEIDSAKNEIFQSLKNTLENRAVEYLDRINAFQQAVNSFDKDARVHRSPVWMRYVYNVISILTIIPAIVRAKESNKKYGTMRFWQPESERAVEGAKRIISQMIK